LNQTDGIGVQDPVGIKYVHKNEKVKKMKFKYWKCTQKTFFKVSQSVQTGPPKQLRFH